MTDLTSTSYRVQIAQGKTYEELGPLSLEELMLLVQKDMLRSTSLCFDDKDNTWKAIDQHPELFQKLFPTSSSQDELYEVLFAKADKPVLKEAKALKEEEIKVFYDQGVLTPNSIVFDKDNKTWVPLRSYKKLFYKLNPQLAIAAPIALPAASKTLAGRLATPTGAPTGPDVLQGSTASKEVLPTTPLHTKNTLPRIHERSAHSGMVVSPADLQPAPITGLLPSNSLAPAASYSAVTQAADNLYATLGQKPISPQLKNAQGSMLQHVLAYLERYSKWLMGLSGLCLCVLVYQYHHEDCKAIVEGLSLSSYQSYLLQYPFVPVLGLYFLLSLQMLGLLQKLPGAFRLGIGFIGGGCLGYYASFLREAPLLWQAGIALGGAVFGLLCMATPRAFTFAVARALSLVLGGYLVYIYKTLGHTSLWIGIILGVMSLYLGTYAYPMYVGRLKQVVFLMLSTFVLLQLCILQYLF